MITKAQEIYLISDLRIKGDYHYSFLEEIGSSPEETKQQKKRDQIFLERFDRREKEKERDGIRHVRNTQTKRKAQNHSITVNEDLHSNVASNRGPATILYKNAPSL